MNATQAEIEFAQYIKVLKQKQFFEWLLLEPFSIVVPANGGIEREIDIKSGSHHKILYLTGNYTTLIDNPEDPGNALDDGTNHITVRFTDGSDDLMLDTGPNPLDLVLSPGRVLSSGITGDRSNQLFTFFPFDHIFGSKGAIRMNFENNADWPNTVNLLYIGKHLLDQRIGKEDF